MNFGTTLYEMTHHDEPPSFSRAPVKGENAGVFHTPAP